MNVQPSNSADDLLQGVEQGEEPLGMGSFASVFPGRWKGQDVAIKCLHPTMKGLDKQGKPLEPYRRFLEECETSKSLDSRYLVRVYGLAERISSSDTHRLVLERLQMTLRERCSRSPAFEAKQEVRIALDVCCGLEYLHRVGIVHRDLTTSNIMLYEESGCRAKITDFGMAHRLRDIALDAETLSVNPGASSYMAPETMEVTKPGRKTVYGKPADMFSMGISVLAMTIRREPPEVFFVARYGRTQDEDDLDKNHPLRNFILRSISEEPSERPTASEACIILKKLQRRAVIAEQTTGDRGKCCLVMRRSKRIVQQKRQVLRQAMSAAYSHQRSTSSTRLDMVLLGSNSADGILERCRRMFAVDGVVPNLASAPSVRCFELLLHNSGDI